MSDARNTLNNKKEKCEKKISFLNVTVDKAQRGTIDGLCDLDRRCFKSFDDDSDESFSEVSAFSDQDVYTEHNFIYDNKDYRNSFTEHEKKSYEHANHSFIK